MRPGRRRLALFWSVLLTLALVWLVLTWGLPHAAMWMTGASRPLPIPGVARAIYLALALLGCAVQVTISDASMREFVRPLLSFLRGPAPGARLARMARLAVLGALPFAAGAAVHAQLAPAASTPTSLRIQHPTMPDAYGRLENPIRQPDDAAMRDWMAARALTGSIETGRLAHARAAIEEGRVIYQINCRPCHGAAADGQGPMAWGFRLKPTDFTDPGTIASVVEAYAFWRVTEGAPGLLPEGSPWDSAMPAWKEDLSEAQRWKAVMAVYDVAGVEPRRPERPRSAVPPPRGFPAAPVTTAEPDTERGRAIYVRHCLPCHGDRGDGQGPVAPFLDPRPRNFVSGSFRLRTTGSGEPPTDEDLLRVVTRGIPGTAMPGWTTLSEHERRLVVAYIKTLSDLFVEKGTPITPSREVPGSPALLARGQALYRTAKCWECHGDHGRGDGPAAPTLTDDAGDVIAATNLTRGWRLKGGGEARDIFMRLSTGMDGTPMPSYADAIREHDRWALAHYVRSLQTTETPGTAVVLNAARIEGDVPRTPDDPRWTRAPALALPLAGQVLRRPRWQTHAVDAVTVRAVYGDAAIAFLLEWDDPVKDTRHEPGPHAVPGEWSYDERARVTRGPQRLRDAIRLQFPMAVPSGLEIPHFLLGDAGRPVTLWHWRADVDATGNNPVVKETADGPQRPLRVPPGPAQDVTGRGIWADGRWKVVMVRALTPRDPGQDVTFEPGRLIPFAVQVWDGANGETGLRMALSSWVFVRLSAPASIIAALSALLAVAAVGLAERWLIGRARASSPVL